MEMLRLLCLLVVLTLALSLTPKPDARFRAKVKGLTHHKEKAQKTKLKTSEDVCTVASMKNNFKPRIYSTDNGDWRSCNTGMMSCTSDDELFNLLWGVEHAKDTPDAVSRYFWMCRKWYHDGEECLAPFLQYITADAPKSRALCLAFHQATQDLDNFDDFIFEVNQLSADSYNKFANALGAGYIAGEIMIARVKRELEEKTAPLDALAEGLSKIGGWKGMNTVVGKAISGYGEVTHAFAKAIVNVMSSTCTNGVNTMGFIHCCAMVNMDETSDCPEFFTEWQRDRDACPA